MPYDPDRYLEPDEPSRDELTRDAIREEFENEYRDQLSKLESQRDDAVEQFTIMEQDRDMWRDRVNDVEDTLRDAQAAEKELSDAYLRIRELLAPDAYRTDHGGSDRFAVTEEALRNRLTRIAELESRCDTLLNSYEARSEHWDGLLADERATHLATQRALDEAWKNKCVPLWSPHYAAITSAREAVEKAGKEGV